MLPTIEVPPVGLKYEEEPGVPSGKKKTVREHVTHFCKNMIKHVPPAWDFGIDGHRCLKRTKPHSQLYRQILLDARRAKLNAVPVTDLRRPLHYQSAIQSIAAETEQKLIVRINPDEFLNPIATVRSLEELASTFGWRFDRLTLLIDLKQELKLSMGSVPDVYEALAESTEVLNDLAGVGLVLTSMNDAVTKGLKPFQTRDVTRED